MAKVVARYSLFAYTTEMGKCFILLCLCVVLTAQAAQADSKTLHVAFDSFPPWTTSDSQGNPDGIDIAFLRLLAQRMNLSLKLINVPFKRGLSMVRYGDIDLMAGVLRRSNRVAYAHFLEPPYKNRTHKAFYVRKGSENRISRYADLRSLRIGTQLGSMYFPRFDEDLAIRKSAVKSIDFNINMLLTGRIDAFICTEQAGDERLQHLGLSTLIAKARFAYRREQNVYMILSKRSPLADRLPEFNRVMDGLVKEGAYDRLTKRYLSRD